MKYKEYRKEVKSLNKVKDTLNRRYIEMDDDHKMRIIKLIKKKSKEVDNMELAIT